MLARLLRGLLTMSALLAAACSVIVGAGELAEGCRAGLKACAGECVSSNDPDFGCGSATCRPCVIAHATARCSASGECVVAACQGQFADCNDDGDAEGTDGCEIDTAHDANHCGSCSARPCTASHGLPDCAGGKCSLSACSAGYRDCNFSAADGCEAELKSDGQHCGACDQPCAASETCVDSACR